MFRTFLVGKDERALLFRKGDFVAVLPAGEFRFFDPFHKLAVEVFALARPAFEHRLADTLRHAEKELVEREFHDVQLGPAEVGLRYENGELVEVLAPETRRLYWKGFADVRVARVDIARELALPYSLTLALGTATGRARVAGAEHVLAVQVPQFHVALLFVDGKAQERLLQPGLHAFWKFHRDLRAELVDLRTLVLEVAGREIPTHDRVALRIKLAAGVKLLDVLLAFAQQARPLDCVCRELQFALRAAIGTRTRSAGPEVATVGVKDAILPGEMKAIRARAGFPRRKTAGRPDPGRRQRPCEQR